MSFRAESPIVTSKTLAKVDETIARSQHAVGLPMEYLRKPPSALSSESERAEEAEESNRKDLLVLQIKDLATKLKTVEYLKNSYEKTVIDLRDRIRDLEDMGERREEQVQELMSASEALKAEKASKAIVTSRETALQQRVEEQDRRIKELERLLRGHNSPSDTYIQQIGELKETIDRLTLENQRLKGKPVNDLPRSDPVNRFDALERRLEALDARCRQQSSLNEDLQRQIQYLNNHSPIDFTKSENVALNKFEEKMRRNTEKIEEMEDKIRKTTGLYEDLRVHVSRSPTNYQDSAATPQPASPRKEKRKGKGKGKLKASKQLG